jgi:putative Mn2+ efflux pump MntP
VNRTSIIIFYLLGRQKGSEDSETPKKYLKRHERGNGSNLLVWKVLLLSLSLSLYSFLLPLKLACVEVHILFNLLELLVFSGVL